MTTPATTMQVQPSALCFAVPMRLDEAVATEQERRFSGVAYGGGLITDHWAWEAVGFDLAGVTAAAPLPLLLQHDAERVIGVIDQTSKDGEQLTIGGRLFTGIEPAAASVAAKADAGAPWQMSVGIFPDSIEEVRPGASFALNGKTHTGPAKVFRQARVREVSFVALGADGSTRANVFSAGAAPVTVATFTTGAPKMADSTPDTAALDAAIAATTAEKARADAAETALSALQAQFAARERTERETAVKALLGETFSADLAAPYMDMTPVQFAAVQAQVGTLRSKLPPGFTSEQATAAGAGSGALTPEGIRKFRADNPGATYEQAFAALTGKGAFVAPAHF